MGQLTDIKRILTGISAMVRELSQLEVEARNTRSRSCANQCDIKIRKINEELKQIQKFHLISVLSNQ